MGKYALVFWTNSNSTSVVLSTAVLDRDMLEEPEKIGKILAAVPGKKEPSCGWKKHDGRVICTDDKLQVLKAKEDSFLKADETDEDSATGRGRRQPKRKRFLAEESDESDSEFSEEEEAAPVASTSKHTAKKVKQAQAERIINSLKDKQQSGLQPPTTSSCKNCMGLREEVARLKEGNLALLRGLPGIVVELGGLVKKMASTNRASQQTTVSSAPPTQPLVATRPSSPARSLASPSPPPSSSASSSPGHTSSDDDLGGGISIPKETLKRCQTHDYKRLVRDLMCALFTQEQMNCCSVYGKKGFGTTSELRQPLPVRKVEAVISYVRKIFPGVETTVITQTMAYKLKDVRKATSKSKPT